MFAAKDISSNHNILIISHNGRLKGGAQFSLLNKIKYLSDKNYNISIFMPSFDGFDFI
tara:strand:- start:288 stop:461 length:174 start_codon:yes stop_codon:yes gene_type:complete